MADVKDGSRRSIGRGEVVTTAEYQPLTSAVEAESPTFEQPPSDLRDRGPEAYADRDSNASPVAEASPEPGTEPDGAPFSWMEYLIFGFLGVAMLWAWNMFLAAAPYFATRFARAPNIQSKFQSAIITVSTLVNLGTLVVLSHMQRAASYPFRINLALIVNIVIFALLTGSTSIGLGASPGAYLAFLLIMVALTSWATGLLQNGAYAFAASFGRVEYTQAVMAGQGVAGVLPSVAQVITVLAFPPSKDNSSQDADAPPPSQGQKSAFAYFLTAVVISVAAIITLIPLFRRYRRNVKSRLPEDLVASFTSAQDAERAARKTVSLVLLFKKLRWLALGVALTFTVTMFFPVFTAKIVSLDPDAGLLFQPSAFIPLGFLFWNVGDLCGRVATALPFSLKRRPLLLFLLALLRIGQLPLYFLCNIGGRGAVVSSDFFYLVVVQMLFGLTNGWLGSSFMMAAGDWVEPDEREAAGGFMGLFLVIGLTVGSLLSFSLSGI